MVQLYIVELARICVNSDLAIFKCVNEVVSGKGNYGSKLHSITGSLNTKLQLVLA